MNPPRDRHDLIDAERALRENLTLLDPATNKIVRNLNIALAGICDALRRQEEAIDALHNKLQPILRELSDEKETVRRVTRPGHR